MKKRGFTYIEVILSLILMLIVINPMYSFVISMKKGITLLKREKKLNDNFEIVLSFYKKNEISREIDLGKEYIVERSSNFLDKGLYRISVRVEDIVSNQERQGEIYVYKQK